MRRVGSFKSRTAGARSSHSQSRTHLCKIARMSARVRFTAPVAASVRPFRLRDRVDQGPIDTLEFSIGQMAIKPTQLLLVVLDRGFVSLLAKDLHAAGLTGNAKARSVLRRTLRRRGAARSDRRPRVLATPVGFASAAPSSTWRVKATACSCTMSQPPAGSDPRAAPGDHQAEPQVWRRCTTADDVVDFRALARPAAASFQYLRRLSALINR
jgi:hypothetical protein